MEMNVSTLDVNGVKYVRADQVPAPVPNGNRAVVVVDRGSGANRRAWTL